jgi:hypothetical protein
MADAKKAPEPAKPEVAPAANQATEPAPIGGLQNERPSEPTGYHCGYCGVEVGREGQHWDGNGNQVEVPHPGVMVLADGWAEDRKA